MPVALIGLFLSAQLPSAFPQEMLIRLSVDAMPAPKPALRIQLLPELKEMQPGNPIPGYLKALLDQDNTTSESNLGPAALRQVAEASPRARSEARPSALGARWPGRPASAPRFCPVAAPE